MKHVVFLNLIVLAALVSWKAHAFPQMLPHGYTSCAACHIAPTGGGVMSAYGRSLSRELLSSYGYEGEEKAFYGAVESPDWLQLAGDFRALQAYSNTPMYEQAKFTVMQADVGAALVNENFQGVFYVGYQNPMSANYSGNKLHSRTHYIQYRPFETEFIRAGKFEMAYGNRFPDHYLFARRDLGWDEGVETYRLEWASVHEKWEVVTSVGLGRPDVSSMDAEKGAAVRGSVVAFENSLLGWNVYYGSRPRMERLVTGPYAALTLLPELTLFAQIDFQKELSTAPSDRFGLVENIRLNYEAFRGLHLALIQEISQLDIQDKNRFKHAYTLSVQWFARPHLEIALGFRKQSVASQSGSSDLAWCMLHYYL